MRVRARCERVCDCAPVSEAASNHVPVPVTAARTRFNRVPNYASNHVPKPACIHEPAPRTRVQTCVYVLKHVPVFVPALKHVPEFGANHAPDHVPEFVPNHAPDHVSEFVPNHAPDHVRAIFRSSSQISLSVLYRKMGCLPLHSHELQFFHKRIISEL